MIVEITSQKPLVFKRQCEYVDRLNALYNGKDGNEPFIEPTDEIGDKLEEGILEPKKNPPKSPSQVEEEGESEKDEIRSNRSMQS